MTRAEVRARFRRIATRVLAAPDPIDVALHAKGLGPEPAKYQWGSTSVTKKNRRRNGNGADTVVQDVADFGADKEDQ